LIPIHVVEHDFLGGLFAGEHHGQHDAVVVDVGFVAEDGDFVVVGELENLLHAGDARHSVADNN
jgi:hypothetical protein